MIRGKERSVMKIPECLKVSGHEIRVEFSDTSHIRGQGEFNHYHNLIRLESEEDTPEDNLAESFLHEIIECIKAKNNLTIEHTDLSVLSESLFQVLRDNRLNFHNAEGVIG